MTELLEEDVELADFLHPEETVDKVKIEDFLLGCVCVAIGVSTLEGNAVQI
jgi:hypothetical protein